MKGILVQKINSEIGDGTPDGTFGRAVLWADTKEEMKKEFPDIEKLYGVIWSDKPHLAVLTLDRKVDIIDEVASEFEVSTFATLLVKQYKEVVNIFNYFE